MEIIKFKWLAIKTTPGFGSRWQRLVRSLYCSRVEFVPSRSVTRKGQVDHRGGNGRRLESIYCAHHKHFSQRQSVASRCVWSM